MLHTVTVAAGALDANGTPLVAPARASFLVRAATDARLAATDLTGERVRVDSSFVITFNRPVDPGTVMSAFTITPQVSGTFALSDRLGPATVARRSPRGHDRPDLHAGRAPRDRHDLYRHFVGKVLDLDRAPLGDPPSLAVRTTIAPAVVRFRPVDGSKDMTRGGEVSVRFTQPMDRRATAAAFSVEVEDEAIAGKVRWAESDTVLVFDPDKDFGYERTIVLAVSGRRPVQDGRATGRRGDREVHDAGEADAPPAARTHPGPGQADLVGRRCRRRRHLGVGRALLPQAHELHPDRRLGDLARRLQQPGRAERRATPALGAGSAPRSHGRTRGSSPTRGLCSHFIGGNPGDRLRRAGYSSYRWAENIGCRSGGAAAAVLGSHLFFQSEKPYNGGHYRNLMDARFTRVGIGVWVSGGRVRLVVDFYHP